MFYIALAVIAHLLLIFFINFWITIIYRALHANIRYADKRINQFRMITWKDLFKNIRVNVFGYSHIGIYQITYAFVTCLIDAICYVQLWFSNAKIQFLRLWRVIFRIIESPEMWILSCNYLNRTKYLSFM